jgi:D-3-phosphoglycerate dehydrogenase
LFKVYITDYIDNPDVEKKILGDYLGSQNQDAEAVLVWHASIDKAFIDSHPKLKFVIRYGVGYDNIDLDYAREKNITVCNTPDYGTDEVSDTAIGMILNITRGIYRYDYQCREHTSSWQENTINTIKRSSETNIGIIGAGRIGGSVVLKANALGFNTAIYDPYQPSGHEKMLSTKRYDSLANLLKVSDIVSLHCPLSVETLGLINPDFIAAMKPHSSLVNTARGELLSDIDILYKPLRDNHLSNVALDVLPKEPPQQSSLINAWKSREDWLDGRLIINPHSAYYSSHSFEEMRIKAATNLYNALSGKPAKNIVN